MIKIQRATMAVLQAVSLKIIGHAQEKNQFVLLFVETVMFLVLKLVMIRISITLMDARQLA